MSRMNIGFLATLLVSLVVFSTSADAQIGTLLPRADALTDGQAFLPSLEDVIQKTKFEKACESSRQVWQFDTACAGDCGDTCTSDCGKACPGKCGSACTGECDLLCAQLACNGGVSEWVWEEADSLVATLPKCDGEKCDLCPSCPEVRESATDQYCKQMAGLLAVTLNGSNANPEAQRRAIEAALKMVAENAQVQSEARIAKLELKYERSIALFQQQVFQMKVGNDSVEQFKTWFQTIYANQNRNFEQIQRLAARDASLNKTVGLLGQKITKLAPSKPANGPQDLRFGQPQNVQNRFVDVAISQFEKAAYKKAEELEIENLRRQIEKLDRQLELLTKPVRRADHLEPIFTPDQPLEPIRGGYSK